jgi:hypothetical protein
VGGISCYLTNPKLRCNQNKIIKNEIKLNYTKVVSIKVKKTAKSLFSMLGTVPDGVKSHNLTASDAYTLIFTESS